MARKPWFILTSDPAAASLLRGVSSGQPADEPRFMRNAHEALRIHLLEELEGTPGKLFNEIDPSTVDTLQVGVGLVDTAPTGGTFALSVNGDSTGLTALSYAITAAALEAIIDAIIPVSVTKTGDSLWTVTVVATNTSITWTNSAANLTPPSSITISTQTAPAVGVQAVYTIEILQSPYAFSDTWTARATSTSPGTVTVDTGTELFTCSADHGLAVDDVVQFTTTDTLPAPLQLNRHYRVISTGLTNDDFKVAEVQSGSALNITDTGTGTHTLVTARDGVTIEQLAPGSSTKPARYKINIDPEPISGAFRCIIGEQQQVKVSCQSNAAVAQIWSLTPTASASITTGSYFDLPDNSDTTERFWIDIDNAGASAPATPSGGSVTEITTINTGDTLLIVAAKLAEALNAHGHFSVTVSSAGVLTITAATAGAKTASKTSSGSSGFGLAISTTGSAGRLAGLGFVLDDQNGTVGVYCTVSGLPATAPDFAAACTRQLPVAITPGGTGSTIGGEIATAVDGDSEFSASNSSGLVTVTDANIGYRPGTTTASSGGFSVTIARRGTSQTCTVPYNSTAAAFQVQMDNVITASSFETVRLWAVSKSGPFEWTLTSRSLGLKTAPVVEDGTLEFLVGLDGTLEFDTLAAHQAHAGSEDDELTATLEVKATITGDSAARVVLHIPCTHPADLLNGDVAASPTFATFRHAAVSVGSGVDDVAVTWSPVFGSPPTKVIAGPLIKADPGDDDPPLVMNVESITTSGCTVTFTGTTTDTYTLGVLAIA